MATQTVAKQESFKWQQLPGLFFQAFDKDNKMTSHGQVIGRVSDTVYIVQLADFLIGQFNVIRLATVEQMMAWDFFETEEQESEAYHKYRDADDERYYKPKW